MTLIRWILARFILFFDMLYRPKGIKRSPQEQAAVDEKASRLSLYQYKACPFCVKVRWAMRRHSIDLEARNPKENPLFDEELRAGGGLLKVPCLRIDNAEGDTEWLYDSSEIITYLEQYFNLNEEPVGSAS
jgi:glutaredoxin